MDSLIAPAFHLSDSSLLTKPIANPKNGEEYIKNVIIERKDCSETVTANLDREKLNKKQNIFIEELPRTLPASSQLLPTPEWQNYQEADFSELRCHISRLYNEKEVWQKQIRLPPTCAENCHELWLDFFTNNEPVLSLVFTMNQPVLEKILDILIENLNSVSSGEGMQPQIGKWLYAVLASLKLPLLPNICSSLRELARKCSQIRANLSPEHEDTLQKAAPLNLFICLVARYFRQGDLAD